MARASFFSPLNWNAEVRATTRKSGTLVTAEIIYRTKDRATWGTSLPRAIREIVR